MRAVSTFIKNCASQGSAEGQRITYPEEKVENSKGKSPVVPFHGITSPYSYFEVIWIFAPIQQEAKHDQEKISAEQKWKVCWQSPAMFCLFTHQAKIQICCTVKLISWNVVNLSHLYEFVYVCVQNPLRTGHECWKNNDLSWKSFQFWRTCLTKKSIGTRIVLSAPNVERL